MLECIAAILEACIDESTDLGQDILDVLLSPLLPAAKVENPIAYRLLGNVLRRVAGKVDKPVSRFLNLVLIGSGDSGDSELAEHVYPLIYELHKIAPALLLTVVPSICAQLEAEEEEVRLKACKLLGRLFASENAEYGEEFTRNFKDFLRRFGDISASVRLEMVQCGALILTRKPLLAPALEGV